MVRLPVKMDSLLVMARSSTTSAALSGQLFSISSDTQIPSRLLRDSDRRLTDARKSQWPTDRLHERRLSDLVLLRRRFCEHSSLY